jgi:CBS domain containing-hemolysin-like protein
VDVATWQWLAALLLVVGAAFLSAVDAALRTLGEVRSRQIVENGGTGARLLSLWTEHPERVRATLAVGATLVGTGMGALAIAWTGGRAGSAQAWAASAAGAAGVLLVVGQLIPRVLGKRYPVRTALVCIPLVHALHWLLWPAVATVERASRYLAKRIGEGEASPAVTTDEIEYLIEVGTREGAFDEVREQLLNSVLEFADRIVREVMVPRTRMAAIDRDAAPEQILRILTENPYSRMPVYQGSIDNVLGVLLVRDLIPELARGGRGTPQLERYLKPPFFVPEQMKISRLLKEMQRRKVHLAVVVDEFGGTAGIVTLEDVIEEIVGEIQDEGDVETVPVRAAGDGVWIADASVSLHELETFLGTHLGQELRFPEDGDYETLAGFLAATAGHVPPVGSRMEWDGLAFTVKAGDERRVSRVEIARRVERAGEAAPGRAVEGA